jgi:hypothetical protein
MASRKVSVDRVEYQALCDLRDGEHARVQLQKIAVDENFAACLAINKVVCETPKQNTASARSSVQIRN